jgi:hypothetical protein
MVMAMIVMVMALTEPMMMSMAAAGLPEDIVGPE